MTISDQATLPQEAPVRSEETVDILVVDDQPANLLALESMLNDTDYRLIRARSGEEALRLLLAHDFALILLDVIMPGLDGFETASLIRGREKSSYVPIIFLTAVNTNEAHVCRGYALGAVDYIFKPIEPEALRAKVSVFVELFRKRRQVQHQLAEHVRMGRALRKSEERYKQLFETASDAVIAFNPATWRITEVNRAVERLYSYTRQELLEMSAPALLGPASLVDPDGHGTIETVQTRRDGSEFAAEIDYRRLVLSDTDTIIAFVRDLTSRKKAAESETLRAREVMLRDFVATVSHELRTPIAAIKGFSETLRRGGVRDLKNRLHFIRIIEKHADKLGFLVEDLLTLAALESGKRKPVPTEILLPAFVQTYGGHRSLGGPEIGFHGGRCRGRRQGDGRPGASSSSPPKPPG
ncbi:MAG: response regulator [Elusimicrobia bacterium]|nr:response regulator [Elusimicrobiota bacterium]